MQLSARNSSDLGLRADARSPTTQENLNLASDDAPGAIDVEDGLAVAEEESDTDAEALEELIRNTVTTENQVQGSKACHDDGISNDETELVAKPSELGVPGSSGHISRANDLSDLKSPPHYAMNDDEILPFYYDDSPDVAKSGGYGNVSKVRIHPDHWKGALPFLPPTEVCRSTCLSTPSNFQAVSS